MSRYPGNDAVIQALAAIVGARHIITNPAEMGAYLIEPRDLYHGIARAVVRPGNTEEVSRLLAFANEHSLAIIPQGGNTGLVGGQVPDASGKEIILSLKRLDRIRDLDPVTETMTVEAGVSLQRAREAAAAADRLFPLTLSSEGSCTIGGILSTNAGGATTIAYGNAREQVLGIEVVLADGRVMNLLGKLRKDNTGYDLKNLFIGAEGTLGIITAAVLRLQPRPRAFATAIVALADPAAAVSLLTAMKRQAGAALTSFELFPRLGIEIVLRNIPGTRDPFAAPHPWYVLAELSGQKEAETHSLMELILDEAMTAGLLRDAALAASLDQRAAFWRLRESMSDAQKPEGGSIKHDVSVPIARVPEFLTAASAAAEKVVPNCRPFAFGHLGDGNIHFNVFQPLGAKKADFLGRWEDMNRAIYDVVIAFGGSISAEHGIGVQKRSLLPQVKDPVAYGLMREVKRLLDPKGILNPGKVV